MKIQRGSFCGLEFVIPRQLLPLREVGFDSGLHRIVSFSDRASIRDDAPVQVFSFALHKAMLVAKTVRHFLLEHDFEDAADHH